MNNQDPLEAYRDFMFRLNGGWPVVFWLLVMLSVGAVSLGALVGLGLRLVL